MADERMVPLYKDGQPAEMAMTPKDFFAAKTMPKGAVEDAGELVTASEAGYRLGDRYEDLTEYDGPKTKAQYTRERANKQVERAVPRAVAVEAPKAEAKKE